MSNVLTVQHYSEDIRELKRLTLAVYRINAVSASVEDIVVNGLNVRPVTIWFEDGGVADVNVNHSDLDKLERAVGSYDSED